MNEKGFIPWIFSEDKKPYYSDNNGPVSEGDKDTLLKPDGQPAHLKYAPDGWADTLVKWGTSITSMGLIREFTVPMKFVKDGAKILRHVMWTKGMEAVAFFALSRLDRLTYPTMYENWFIGELDMTEFKQSPDNVTVNVMEGGASKLLKSNENTDYTIPINTDPERKILYLDGLPFTNKITWTVYNNQEILGTSDAQFYWLGMGIISTEGTTQGIIVQDQPYAPTSAFPNESYFLWSVDKTISVRISGNITGACTMGTGGLLTIDIRRASDSVNTVFETRNIGVPGTFNNGDTFSHNFDEIITVNPYERLYIRIGGRFATSKFIISGFQINVEYDVTFTPSFCEFLTPFTLAQRLAERVFNGKYGVRSTFLQSLDDIAITSGTAIRKYQSESSIKTSLSDFLQSMKTRGRKKYSIGWGIINDELVIEELDYFFTSDIIMDLGLVTGLDVVVANDLNFNTIKVGYPNQTIDKVNGRNEFNVTQLYSTPNTRKPKELDLVSKYRADMYGIEVTRIDLYGKDTTDNKADNDTFLISVEKKPYIDVVYFTGAFSIEIRLGLFYFNIPQELYRLYVGETITVTGTVSNNGTFTIVDYFVIAGFTLLEVSQTLIPESVLAGTITSRNTVMYSLNRPAYTAITGLLHPDESFNIPLNPKQNLLNVGGYIHSILDKLDIKLIKFETGDKNSELSTTLAGVTVTQKANVVIGSLQNKLFLPYYFTFTCLVPDDAMTILKANPYGRIKFTDDKTGLVLYGRMWDGGIKPEPNDKQQWKLIASPNQDLSKFI